MADEIRITFVGHATVGVGIGDTLLLTDPILRRQVNILRWAAPEPDLGAFSSTAAVLISHLHYDHCDLASLALLGRDRTLLVPDGSSSLFTRRGFTHVVPMRPGSSYDVDGLTITATEADHDGRRRPFGASGPALGYLVTGRGRRVYFAGDTDLFPAMKEIGEDLDIALLPIWGWGTSLGPGHLDPFTAADAAALIEPRLVVPIHWGAMRPVWERRSPATWMAPAEQFEDAVRRRDRTFDTEVVLPGASLTWSR